MNTYSVFLKKVITNYISGSLIAVFGVGSVFIFSTLAIPLMEILLLVGIMLFSFICMVTSDILILNYQLKPIKKGLMSNSSLEEMRDAFSRVHKFPLSTILRINVPHLLGFSVPGFTSAAFFYQNGYLSIPGYYIILAMVGAVLIAGMHSVIEYFLTTKSIKPLLYDLRRRALMQYNEDLAQPSKIYTTIRSKVLFTAIYIGIFPLLLFSLATQVHLSEASVTLTQEYWSWAAIVMFMSIAFSSFVCFLLLKDIGEPIANLEKGMRLVKKGKYEYRNEVYSDEFSTLIAGYNQMLEGLKAKDRINSLLTESLFRTLAMTLDAKDLYTAGHSIRVAEYAFIIGEQSGMSKEELDLLKKTALLHDIGKIGIKDSILLKDGRLTEEEFEEIKLHPVIGANILANVEPASAMAPLIPGVRYHHERYDGLGYPDGLKGESIPKFGRILAVADAYDAMTSDRPYRKGMPVGKALSILREGRGTQWDPFYTELFLKHMEKQGYMGEELGS
ncbi:HD domain-containing protein [Bacillus sp. FJAT-42376]|uniref:HD-GYP domain-containing protein n=1 Tax=Bacillus sp. FJAT-42376 TaxID=2014076 RepID=UPI000F50BD65|nr:HD-GYP domain-containing protein [Bacillus sp. FJAT-42376]AZB42617.1 HD domain-containing protein [Bacillus sp. FJAT-42376]